MTEHRHQSVGPVEPVGGRTIRLSAPLPLHWAAGYEYVLTAIRLLVEDSIPVMCWLPPTGPDVERTRFAVHDLRLTDIVRLGRPGPIDVHVATPLLDDDWPELAVLEHGDEPAVVTDLPRLGSRVDHRDAVRIVPRRDPRAIAAAVAALSQP